MIGVLVALHINTKNKERKSSQVALKMPKKLYFVLKNTHSESKMTFRNNHLKEVTTYSTQYYGKAELFFIYLNSLHH